MDDLPASISDVASVPVAPGSSHSAAIGASTGPDDLSMHVYPNGTLEAIGGSQNSAPLNTAHTQHPNLAFPSVQQQQQQQQQQAYTALPQAGAGVPPPQFRRSNVPGSRPYSSGRYAAASAVGWPSTGISQQAYKSAPLPNQQLTQPPMQQLVPELSQQQTPQTLQQAVAGQVGSTSTQYGALPNLPPNSRPISTLPHGLVLGQKALPLQLSQPQQQQQQQQRQQQLLHPLAQPQQGLPLQQPNLPQQPQQMVSFRSPAALGPATQGLRIPSASAPPLSTGLNPPATVGSMPPRTFLNDFTIPMGGRPTASIPLGTTAAAAAATLPPNWNLVGGPGTRPARMLQTPAPRPDAIGNPQQLYPPGGQYLAPGQLGLQPAGPNTLHFRPGMAGHMLGMPPRGPTSAMTSRMMSPSVLRPHLVSRTGARPVTPTVRSPVLQPTTPLSSLSPEAIAALLRPQGSTDGSCQVLANP